MSGDAAAIGIDAAEHGFARSESNDLPDEHAISPRWIERLTRTTSQADAGDRCAAHLAVMRPDAGSNRPSDGSGNGLENGLIMKDRLLHDCRDEGTPLQTSRRRTCDDDG